jgi:hypothetical protein
MNRPTLIVLIAGTAIIAGCNKQPAKQSVGDYYRDHPEVPNPRAGSYAKSKPGTYEYVTPTDNGSSAGNSAAPSKP